MSTIIVYVISLILGVIGGLGRYSLNARKLTSGVHFFGIACMCVYMLGRYPGIHILGVIATSFIGAFITFSSGTK